MSKAGRIPGRVFILGLQRSGTTWLANMLANVPGVAAVAHADHQGVHESVFFSHFARNFGSWDDMNARRAFIDAFGQSDYFRLTELEPELLQELSNTRHSYGEVFVAVMDLFAIGEGATLWIEKSPHHTILTDDILAAAPDAKFVMVERSLPDLVSSRLHGFGRVPKRSLRFWLDVARGALTASFYRREMRRLARGGRGLLVRYEDLKVDPGQETRQRILDFLGLDAAPEDMWSAYRANSSYGAGEAVELDAKANRLIGAVAAISWMIPLGVLRRIQARRDLARGADWPDWVWSQTGYDPTAQTIRDRVILD